MKLKKPTYIARGPHDDCSRKTFQILKGRRDETGKRSYDSIELPELNALNKSFKDKKVKLAEATASFFDILRNLKQQDEIKFPKEVFNKDNETIFHQYWKDRYSRLPEEDKLVDEASARNDFKRTLKCLGDLNLRSASTEELVNKTNQIQNFSSRLRVINRINSLLSYINRKDARIIVPKNKRKKKKNIKYINHRELNLLLIKLPDQLRLLVQTAFYSGLRIGECFAITETSLKGSYLQVQEQLDRNLEQRDTKTKQNRRAYIIPEGREAVAKWAALDIKTKKQLRNYKYSIIIKSICKELFPEDKHKHCTFHDLRHSYAVHLLSKGVSLSLVAQSLGNSVSVAEEYYAGYTLSDDAIDSIDRVIKKSEKIG